MNEERISALIAALMDELHELDPQDGSEQGQSFTTLMTLLEQAYSYAKVFCD